MKGKSKVVCKIKDHNWTLNLEEQGMAQAKKKLCSGRITQLFAIIMQQLQNYSYNNIRTVFYYNTNITNQVAHWNV